jgi:mitochondrial-processing peptidase subunit alpha
VALGFEGNLSSHALILTVIPPVPVAPSHKEEKDFVAACVLSQLLGGGGSFSAGGPGKGLYSRFYMNVLNRYSRIERRRQWLTFLGSRNEQIKTAISYNQAYSDSGCLYFHFGGDPSYLRNMTDVAIREIGYLVSHPPESIELERAKKQLQSMLFMNLEQRPVVFEDVARQVLAVGKRQQAEYYYNRIGRIALRVR